jgi:outer membrane protein assembly factor BamB
MENRISPRDLCPPVAAGHRVVVAPVDSDRLFCLDALTGSSLWECEAVEVVHLLGIYRGRLIFTTPRGLCAVAADTGHDDGGWRVPANGSLPPAGRGLVADGWALFPTQAGKNSWRGIDGLSGESIRGAAFCDPATMRLLPPGNAAFGNGCLVIATADALWGFPPPQPPFAQSRN